MGKYIIIAGLIITLIGVISYFFGKIFSWIGNLSEEIKFEKGKTRVCFPITTMIVITIAVNIVVRIICKF